MKNWKSWFISLIAVVFLLGSVPTQAINLRVLVDPDDTTRRQEFDTKVKAPITIDVDHHELHEGEAFMAHAVDTSMAATDKLIMAFKTSDSARLIHMVVSGHFKAAGHIDVDEGCTWTAETGTATTIYNRERDGTFSSSGILENADQAAFTVSSAFVLNPTGYSAGTVIHSDYTFAQGPVGGGTRATEEIVFARDTTYFFVYTADGATNAADLELDWDEHTSE